MNTFTAILVIATFFISAQASAVKSIRTDVFCSRTDADFGNFVELKTTIRESGNGQIQSSSQATSLTESSIFSGFGAPIASATFTGLTLPSAMHVRVFEDDVVLDDGVCVLDINAKFSTHPVSVKCTREARDGLAHTFVITVRIYQV